MPSFDYKNTKANCLHAELIYSSSSIFRLLSIASPRDLVTSLSLSYPTAIFRTGCCGADNT